MYCNKCGTKLDDNAKFCNKCGNKIKKQNNETAEIIDDNDNQKYKNDICKRVGQLFGMKEYKCEKIKVIKIIQDEFNIGLREAKSIVDEYLENSIEFESTYSNSENKYYLDDNMQYAEKSKITNEYVSSDRENEDYIFLNNIVNKKRKRLNNRLELGKKVINWLLALATIWFIYKQIDMSENYKFIIYTIRYFIFIIPFCFFVEVYDEIYKLFLLKRNSINKNYSKTKIIVIKVIYVVFLLVVMNSLINPTDNGFGLLKVLVQENFFVGLIEYLLYIKFEIFCLIILGIGNYYVDTKILGFMERKINN